MNKDQEIFKLIFFYTDKCNKCEAIKQMVSELADEFSGKALIIT